LWQGDTIVTAEQGLPAQDHYTVVLPGGDLVTAFPGSRDRVGRVASLSLNAPVTGGPSQAGAPIAGTLVVVVAADENADPAVRLSVIHRAGRGSEGPVLDLAPHQLDPGAIVLDGVGGLIGIVTAGPRQQALVVPAPAIARCVSHLPVAPVVIAAAPRAEPAPARRGWLGLGLQPCVVPETLVPLAGQTSGRMVVGVTPGGPADRGGLHIGDVLLTIDGTSASGPQALRAFLGADRIGATVLVTLLRDGEPLTATLTVAQQPV
jgi:hypothetical protein